MTGETARRARMGERRESSAPQSHAKAFREARDGNVIQLPEKIDPATVGDIHRRMVNILPRLQRFVHSLTNGSSFTDDLVQETYARALAHLDQWQPGSRLDSWMFRIARNLWIDQVRSDKFRGEVVDIDVVDHLLSCDGQRVAENRIVLDELRRDIAELSMDQRDVIRLIWFYGMSYKETGKLLNVPPGTVMSRMARVRGVLQKFA
jgi:RNA polymerase sigma-70 factor (ECF subfamily)